MSVEKLKKSEKDEWEWMRVIEWREFRKSEKDEWELMMVNECREIEEIRKGWMRMNEGL